MQMHFEFEGEIFEWRGPAPHYFIAMPHEQSRDLKVIQSLVTYGWGVIPAQVRIGDALFTTSLIPRGDRFLVPIKASVRRSEQLEEGDVVRVQLMVTY